MDPRAPLPLHRLPDEEIERLLASGERRQELIALFGARGYRELSELARRARTSRVRGGTLTYVLPGLMGSRIGTRGRLLDDVLWLDPIEIAAGHLTRLALPRGARLSALGVMLLNALKLKLSLTIAGFDARLHAYDWRLGVEHLASQLNARLERDGGSKVMLVGHSLGGVVARVALTLDAGRISRVIQLGAPNFGSFAPVLALRGVYPTVRKLAALDLRHNAEDLARIIFRTLPSLHDLLPDPGRVGGADLFEAANWPQDGLRPDPALLSAAVAARRIRPEADARCLHIVGVRQETVTAAELKGTEFQFRMTRDGDGTVPRVLAELPGARHWYAVEKHGGLPNNGRVISAVVDLLRRGETDRLRAQYRGRSRTERRLPESVLRRVAPHKVRWQDLSPDARRRLLEPIVSPEFHVAVPRKALRAPATPIGPTQAPQTRTIEIRLSRGSIADASARALVLGVFRNVDPSGAASDVDDRLGGAVREFALRRMFSGELGQVFVMPSPRPTLIAEYVLFAGLGDFDDFGTDAQAFVAENVVRTFARTGVQDFATVLFGAGSGIPAALALEQQMRGFLLGLGQADDERVIRRITICEIDPRKFAILRRAMPGIVRRLGGNAFTIIVDETAPAVAPSARSGRARAARAASLAEDPTYLMVSFFEQGRSQYDCRASLLTAGAKAAVLSGTLRIRRSELRDTLAEVDPARLSNRTMGRFGSRLAKRLLSDSVRDGLAAMSRRPLVLVHDREASRVPWETLNVGGAHPALERGLSRRYASDGLSVARWRDDRRPGDPIRVLMVANPTLDLPGADEEGEALRRRMLDAGALVDCLAGSMATRDRLLREIESAGHDILHFAGHAFFDASDPGRSGLVCARGEVLRGSNLDGIGDLPALVFFNACEAARVRRTNARGRRALLGYRQSSSIAEAFLNGGVANFVGTHWPVGDDAAHEFSTHFYEHLLAGKELGDAVLAARRRIFERGSIDWADYVLYGNPSFRLAQRGTGEDR